MKIIHLSSQHSQTLFLTYYNHYNFQKCVHFKLMHWDYTCGDVWFWITPLSMCGVLLRSTNSVKMNHLVENSNPRAYNCIHLYLCRELVLISGKNLPFTSKETVTDFLCPTTQQIKSCSTWGTACQMLCAFREWRSDCLHLEMSLLATTMWL